MTIPNYLALYNLSQIDADILIVSDLTATTGTIYTLFSTTGTITTLNSTTGTITTLNSTTGNITTLNTNTIQASPISSAVNLYTTHTGTFTLGNTSNTNGLTINNNTILASGKTITLNTTGGKVKCDVYTGTTTTSAMTLGEFGDTSNITFYKNINMGLTRFITIQSDGILYVNTITGVDASANATLFSDHTANINLGFTSSINPINLNCNTILPANKTITLNATGGKIKCNVYTGTTTASNLTIGESGNTGNLDIFKTITSNNTYSGTNTFSGANTHSGATNTFSNTLLCNTIIGLTAGDAVSLFGTSTSLIDLGNTSSTSVIRINQNISVAATKILRTPYLYPISTVADLYIGNQATDSGILYIELNTDLHSSRKLKLNNTTASKLLLTNASKEIISSAYDELTLPVSTLTQAALNLKANINAPVFTTSIGLTSGDITISSGNLLCNTYRGTAISSAISLFSTTTAGLTLGGASSGISLADNTTLASGKTLTLNTTGGIVACDTYNATSISSTLELGKSLTTGSINLASAQTTGSVNISTLATSGSVNILNTASSSTGSLIIGSKYRQSRYISVNLISSYWNTALGTANNVFQSSVLSASAFPPVYVGVQADSWSVWESNAGGESCFIAQNGNTCVLCNPGDNYAFHWVDEDFLSLATGFKFDTSGNMTTTSDARAKTNIKSLNKNNLLNKLNKIDIINYTKKRLDGITRAGADKKYAKVHIGYTAQNLLEIGLDEFVEQPTTPDGYMSVCYGDIQFLFNAGVQELIKENRQQQKQIDDLTARLEKLEKLLIPI